MNDTLFLTAALIAGAGFLAYLATALIRAWSDARPRPGGVTTKFGENIRVRDLFRAAVIIEEEGKSFYGKLEGLVSAPEAKKLCADLAAEEEKHRQFVQDQLDRWRPLATHARHWPRFLEQLKAEGFFPEPPQGAGEKELAAYAIRQEIKSAEFYRFFEEAFPETWRRERIHRLVEEELRHAARLRALYPGAL